MKWLVMPAVGAFSLAVTTALASPTAGTPGLTAQKTLQLAQRDQDRDRDRSRDNRSRPAPPAARPTPQQAPRPGARTQAPANRAQQAPRPGARTPPAPPARARIQQQQRYDWRRYQPGKLPPDWRQHNSFNRNAWERNLRAEHRYRVPAYRRPTGWYYRTWVFGMILPTIFWTRDYWIIDYWLYGLENPPYGYVWVRYDGDALLVNVHTGRVLRVVYGLFY